jgi:hypothetical protein
MAVNKLKVKPAKKKIAVKHPFQQRDIETAGEEILDCPWLRRRLNDGDLILVTAKASKKKAHQPKKIIDETGEADQADDS